MKKWLIIGLTSLIIFIIAILGTIMYINRNNTLNIQPTSQKELANKLQENLESSNVQVVSTLIAEEELSPNAVLKFKTYYRKCGHERTQNIDIPQECVNMTQQEIKQKYNEWELIEFNSSYVVFRKEEDGICNEHYLLKEYNGYIAIYTIDENEKETLKEITGVVTSYLPETDLLQLREGIKLYGKENLNARLEDYE